jgi:excisionase family DNA binding protein
MPATDQPEFLTVREAAERLRLNEQTIRNWIDAGELRSVRVGRRVRIPRAWLDDFVGYRQDSGKQPSAGILAGVNQEQVATALETISRGIQQLADALRNASDNDESAPSS